MYKISDFQFMVSRYCPGECLNCGIWKLDREDVLRDEISLELFEKIAQNDLLKNTGYIQLTGGEVHLSPKYEEVVRLLSRYKPDAYMHTNISGWYPERHYRVVLECLRYVDHEKFRIDISMDGRPENYRKVRLRNGGWEKAVETAERLRSLTNNIRFVFTIYKQNFEDMEWFIGFAKEMDVGFFFEFARENIFLNNEGLLGKTMAFTDHELEAIEKILVGSGFLKRRDRELKWLRAKGIYKGYPLPFECNNGKESLVMDPYGNIYPCLETRETLQMGNIRDFDGDLRALLYSERALQVLEIINNKDCQPCSMLCVHKLEMISSM